MRPLHNTSYRHCERHAAHLLRRVAITARAPALRERSNLVTC